MIVDTESDSSVKMSFLAPFDLQIASLMMISVSLKLLIRVWVSL